MDLVGGEVLVLKERLGDGFDLIPVVEEHPLGVRVGLVHDAAGFLVDHLGGLVGVVLVGDERVAGVLARVVDEPELGAHAPLEDHGASEAGCLTDVARCAGRDIVHRPCFSDASAADHAHGRMEPLEPVPHPVLLGEREGCAAVVAAGDDGHLVQRVGVLEQRLEHGVPGFVVRDELVLFFLTHARLVGASEPDLVAGLFEVLVLDELLVEHGRGDRGLVYDRGEIRAGEHGGATRDLLEIDIGPELDLLGVDLEDLQAPGDIGKRDGDLAIEASGSDERGVEHIGAVGRGDNDDAVARAESVHLDENGVEGLLAFVVAAAGEPAAATTTDGVDLVEEDDAGGGVLGLLEQVTDARCADADEHLDEVGTRDREEGDIRFARDGLGEEGLAAPRLTGEEHAPGDASAQAGESLGVLEELDDLGDFGLCFFDAGDILEGDAGHLFGHGFVTGLAEGPDHAPAAARGTHAPRQDEPDDRDEQDHRTEHVEELHEPGGRLGLELPVGELVELLGFELAIGAVELDSNELVLRAGLLLGLDRGNRGIVKGDGVLLDVPSDIRVLELAPAHLRTLLGG